MTKLPVEADVFVANSTFPGKFLDHNGDIRMMASLKTALNGIPTQ